MKRFLWLIKRRTIEIKVNTNTCKKDWTYFNEKNIKNVIIKPNKLNK